MNLPTNAGDAGSIPGSGRSPEKKMAAHSSILAWTGSMVATVCGVTEESDTT